MIKKAAAVALTGVIAIGAFTACTSTTTPAEAETAPLTSGVLQEAADLVPAEIRDAGTLRIAAGVPYPPFVMYDGDTLTGFDYDLAQALGEKLDLKADVRHQNFETIIPALQSDTHDIIMAGMNDTVERQKTLSFIDYLYAGFTIVVEKGNPEDIGTLLDLCGQTVAVQKSTTQGQILRDLVAECADLGKDPVEVQELPAANDAQTALKAGRVTAYVTDAPVAAYTIATSGDGKDFEGVEDPQNPEGFAPVYTGIGVLKDQSELVEALRLALDSLIEEGVYQDLLEEYGMSALAVDEALTNRTSE